MISLSPCKINLGLNIIERRADGFHNIETLMYPVRELTDMIEIQKSDTFTFTASGIAIDCPIQSNLCVKAYKLIQIRYGISPAAIHIHKRIPSGAGLGGGSANATTVLSMCNELWQLSLSEDTLRNLAAELGSDTPFFVSSQAQLATGRGEILSPFDNFSLSGLWLMLVKAEVGVSTAQAYAGVKPHKNDVSINETLRLPINKWRELLVNDFEESIFPKLPLLAQIKEKLYTHGALYAAMSGSGSTIFGLFESKPTFEIADHFVHIEQL